MAAENDDVEKTVTYTAVTNDNRPGQPGQPGVPGNDQPVAGNQEDASFSNHTAQQRNQQLPQTGNTGNRWAVVGLALSSMTGLIGLGKRRKQD
jgi:LPXTG-motif cell wall-anchored protein